MYPKYNRWVASLGDGTTTDAKALALLDAILRVSTSLGGANLGKRKTEACKPSSVVVEGKLQSLPEWASIPLRTDGTNLEDAPPANCHAQFSVLSTILGTARTPPNRHDLRIYEAAPDTFGLRSSLSMPYSAVTKHEVPFAPGAFMLTGLLSRAECTRFIQASEEVGFVPDEPAVRTSALLAATPAGLRDRAANFTLLADDSILVSALPIAHFKQCARLPSKLMRLGQFRAHSTSAARPTSPACFMTAANSWV